jgi:hypothetical protein
VEKNFQTVDRYFEGADHLRANGRIAFDTNVLAALHEVRWWPEVIQVSGSYIHAIDTELEKLDARQRFLREQIECYFFAEAKPCNEETLSSRTLREEDFAAAIESVRVSADDLASSSLIDYLIEIAMVTFQVVQLRRQRKAAKRAMRKRVRASFCGFSFSKRIWYLMHGGRPPKASVLNADLAFGTTRA